MVSSPSDRSKCFHFTPWQTSHSDTNSTSLETHLLFRTLQTTYYNEFYRHRSVEFGLDLWVDKLLSDEQNDHCYDSQDDRRPVDVSDHLEQ